MARGRLLALLVLLGGSNRKKIWVVVSNIFYFHPYLGKIPILTNIFQMGWNHQLVEGRYSTLTCFLWLLKRPKTGMHFGRVFFLPEGSVNLRFSFQGLISHRSSGCGGALFDPWGVTQADDVSWKFMLAVAPPKKRYMGVSKNRGTPKWMIYNGKPC